MHQKEFRSEQQLTPFFYILRPYPHPAMKAYLPSSRGRFRKTDLAISKSYKVTIEKNRFASTFYVPAHRHEAWNKVHQNENLQAFFRSESIERVFCVSRSGDAALQLR